MIINNLTPSKTEAGHPDSNIAFITISYQPIMQDTNSLSVNSDSMLYTIGLIFKPNTKMYDFFLDNSENATGNKITLTIATKSNSSPNSVAHVFTYGEKPYILSFNGNGQEFVIEDIVLNDVPSDPENEEQIRSIASGKKKTKSVSIYTGPSIIAGKPIKANKKQILNKDIKIKAQKTKDVKNNQTSKTFNTKKTK